MSRPKLAVVVPAYNEESRILPTLERINEYFQSVDYSVAVIVVSDGSRDRTNEIVEIFSSTNEATSLLAYSPNRGKGYAVRRGILSADADYVLFSDADLAAPIEEIEKLWLAISDDVPVAIGSRPLKESNLEIRQPWYREMLGRLFNKAVQTLAIRGIEDTQCGFKIF
ncbi:glycosyltransferase, partial [Kamptonema cortianum]|nr:glycosyltransferase [Kamptonema cortianum]